MGQGQYQLLAPGMGDVRAVTTYRSQDGECKVIVVERVIQAPQTQAYYAPIQNPNPIVIDRRNEGCESQTYEYQGGNPFNKDSWKRKD